MRTLHIEAVVAYDRTGEGIGHADKLPWSLPVDMKRFRTLTTGHAVLMGTKTALSIGKALPKRRNYVLTRSGKAPFEGVIDVASMQQAVNHYLALTEDQEDVRLFVCGGEEVYRAMIPYMTGIHQTIVYARPQEPHDRFFPMDDLLTYHGEEAAFKRGEWVVDGPESTIWTYYDHSIFVKHEGTPVLSLPAGVRLASATVGEEISGRGIGGTDFGDRKHSQGEVKPPFDPGFAPHRIAGTIGGIGFRRFHSTGIDPDDGPIVNGPLEILVDGKHEVYDKDKHGD